MKYKKEKKEKGKGKEKKEKGTEKANNDVAGFGRG